MTRTDALSTVADLALAVGYLEQVAGASIPRRQRRARADQVASYGQLVAARYELDRAVRLCLLRDMAGAWADDGEVTHG